MSTHHHAHHHRRTPSALKTSGKGLNHQRPGLPRSLSSPKIALGKKRTTEIETESDCVDSEDDMTFLQYCPTCDKQIVVPNTSILYCSESCRRKDAFIITNTALPPSPLSSPLKMPDTSPPPPSSITRTIVPPREPSTLLSFRSKPAVLHAAKSDLDPTEWKPDAGLSLPARPPAPPRTRSAASDYLALFHRGPVGPGSSRRAGGLHIARTAPGLGSGLGSAASSSSVASSALDSDSDSDASSVASSSRDSSVVGTPAATRGSRPLVYSASTATMAVDVNNAAGAELCQKSCVACAAAPGLDVEGGLKRLLGAAAVGGQEK